MTEISKNKSLNYAKHILDSRSANCMNIPNSKLDVTIRGSRKRTCSGLVDPHF